MNLGSRTGSKQKSNPAHAAKIVSLMNITPAKGVVAGMREEP